jgi:hypothetical protein
VGSDPLPGNKGFGGMLLGGIAVVDAIECLGPHAYAPVMKEGLGHHSEPVPDSYRVAFWLSVRVIAIKEILTFKEDFLPGCPILVPTWLMFHFCPTYIGKK